ncbi:MAG: XRE family transcriptional regulator [Victivallaceae bacterium]|nr:XRE family transcriptional regulator [Victivallaceae bacterium]
MDLLKVSQRIRHIRIAQNLTVEELARKSGFSKGFVSQVENFRLTPSLKALNKLSEALGVGLSELFGNEGSEPQYLFGKLDDGVEINRNDSDRYGIRYFALAYGSVGRKIEAFVIEYTPAKEDRDFLMHDSEELFIMLEGTLEFSISEAANTREVQKADTVYLKANLPHKVKLAPGCAFAKALVIYSPK